MSAPLLEARGLSKSYAGQALFEGLTLKLGPGDAYHLVGENGSGKSTFLRALAGHCQPDAGDVFYGGEPARGLEPWKREVLAPFVDQEPIVDLQVDKAIDNLFDAATLGGRWRGWIWKKRKRVRSQILERLRPLATSFGLDQAMEKPGRHLSYGQRRLLALLRALSPRLEGGPRVLLLDEPLSGLSNEPTSGLAEARTGAVIEAIRGRLQEGWALVVAEHLFAIEQLDVKVLNFPHHGKGPTDP